MVSLKVPEDLDKCIVILDAETEDDLETHIQGLKVDVPPRAQDPATDVREQWQIPRCGKRRVDSHRLVLSHRCISEDLRAFHG